MEQQNSLQGENYKNPFKSHKKLYINRRPKMEKE